LEIKEEGFSNILVAIGGLVLDSDDYLCDTSYISKAVQLIEENKNVVLVHANVRTKYEGTDAFKDSNKQLEELCLADGCF